MTRRRHGWPLGMLAALAGAVAGLVALLWLAMCGLWTIGCALAELGR